MKPRLCYLHVGGPESAPDTDVFPSDLFFCIPYALIEQAIEQTKIKPEEIFIWFDFRKSEWRSEKSTPGKLDEKFVVKVQEGAISSHEIISTM